MGISERAHTALLNCWCNITIYRAIRELSDRRRTGTRVVHTRYRCFSPGGIGRFSFTLFSPFPVRPFFYSLNNYMRVDVLYSRRDLRYTILNARSSSRDAINWHRVPREERIHGTLSFIVCIRRFIYFEFDEDTELKFLQSG